MINRQLDIHFESYLEQLLALGANAVDHLNGSLVNHLHGTYKLLKSWNADYELCIAGLYHAIYGTSGFDKSLISDSHRDKIKEILGTQSEQIVYTYCACERDFFWEQIGIKDNPVFLDRFTGNKYCLSLSELKYFCELTVANELEIAKDNDKFIQKYGKSLNSLFLHMKPYISQHATYSVIQILG
jgi:hypothetical protein